MNKGLVKFLICSSLIIPLYDISTNIINTVQAKEVRQKCTPDHVYEISKNGDTVTISFKNELTSQNYPYKGIEELGECKKIVVTSEANLGIYDFKYVADQASLGATEIDFSQAKMESTYQMAHTNTSLEHVTKIALPDGLKIIGAGSFYGLTGLKEINIPDSVIKIERDAFQNCGNLTGNLTLPSNLEYIGNYAFYRCAFTGDLIIPNSVTSIGSYAFAYTGFDGKLKLSENLTHIASNTFYYCKFTGNLIIPNSVTSISSYAFRGCSNFNGTLKLSENLEKIGYDAFEDCVFTGDLIIPDSVKEIGHDAFSYASFDGKLKLSKNLKQIEARTFYNCRGLKGDLIIPDSVKVINNNAFNFCSFDGKLKLGKNLLKISDYAFSNNNFTGQLTIPNNVAEIGYAAFSNNNFTGQLTIPDSVYSIGSSAFSSCINITGVTLPDTITSIGSNTFYNCRGLKGELIIPNSVTQIGSQAFYNCTNLKGDLIIPDSVIQIGTYSFGSSGFDGKLKLSKNLTEIPTGAFHNLNMLNGTVSIPDKVKSIGNSSFSGCINLRGDLKIPDSVESIGNYAFQNCGFNGELTLSKNLNQIGYNAFENCKNLKGNLLIPEGVTSIGSRAFYQCVDLTGKFSLPNSLEKIDSQAFSGCSNLNGKVTISTKSKLSSVVADAFFNTKGISITIGEPKVNKYKINDTSITGNVGNLGKLLLKGNPEIMVKLNNKYYKTPVNEIGTFKVQVPKLKSGDELNVYIRYKNAKGAYQYSSINKLYVGAVKLTVTKVTPTYVTGKTLPNIKASVRIGNKYYSAQSNAKGEYKITIPKQKYGAKIKVYSKKHNVYSNIEEVTIKPTKPTVSTLKVNLVKGKADANMKVTVRIGNKYYSSTATKYGNYSIKIPKQKYGTKIKVYAKSSNGVYSDIREIEIKK